MGLIKTGIVQRTTQKGGKKLYATTVMYSNIKNDDLIEYMSTNAKLSKTVALATVSAFRGLMDTFVLNGHAVVIPQFGTFSLGYCAKAVDKPEDISGSQFTRLKVRFTPERILRNKVKSVKFSGILPVDDTVGSVTP